MRILSVASLRKQRSASIQVSEAFLVWRQCDPQVTGAACAGWLPGVAGVPGYRQPDRWQDWVDVWWFRRC
jgi:hypothetical protein